VVVAKGKLEVLLIGAKGLEDTDFFPSKIFLLPSPILLPACVISSLLRRFTLD
jgi:hypothetical protein